MVIAEAPALSVDTLDITDSDRYRDFGYPWAEWDVPACGSACLLVPAAGIRAVLGDYQTR